MNRLAAGLESPTRMFSGVKRGHDDEDHESSKRQCLRVSPQTSPRKSALLVTRRVRELQNSPSKDCGVRPCRIVRRRLFGEDLSEQRSKRKVLDFEDVPSPPTKKMKVEEKCTGNLPEPENDEFEQLLEQMEACFVSRALAAIR